jgi:hypothetical protein
MVMLVRGFAVTGCLYGLPQGLHKQMQAGLGTEAD